MADIVEDIRHVLSLASPRPWRRGKTGDSVVSDEPLHNGHLDPVEHEEYYGGALVAESMSAGNRALIVAAPDLLARAAEVIEGLRRDRAQHLQQDLAQIEEDKAVMARARAQRYYGPWNPGERIP